jgi:hypothetical protein
MRDLGGDGAQNRFRLPETGADGMPVGPEKPVPNRPRPVQNAGLFKTQASSKRREVVSTTEPRHGVGKEPVADRFRERLLVARGTAAEVTRGDVMLGIRVVDDRLRLLFLHRPRRAEPVMPAAPRETRG